MAKKKINADPEKAKGVWFDVTLRVQFRLPGLGETDDDEHEAVEDEVMRRIDHFREANGLLDSTCVQVRRASS